MRKIADQTSAASEGSVSDMADIVKIKKERKAKDQASYALYGDAVRAEYLRTGNLRAAAELYSVPPGTAHTWSAKYGWKEDLTAKRSGGSFLQQFAVKLQEHVNKAGDDWSDSMSVIKGLSDLVLAWQTHEDRRAESSRREAREIAAAKRQQQVDLPAIFLDHLQFVFSILKGPAKQALADEFEGIIAAYKVYVAEKASH